MHVADTLSRSNPKVEQTLFEQELEMICAIEADDQDANLETIRHETENNTALQCLAGLVPNGWPVDKKMVPQAALPYFTIRDEIVTDGGLS